MYTLKTIILALMLIVFSVAGLRAEPVAIYATTAKNIRIVPLVQGDIPDLNKGIDLIASAPCEDDATQPVHIVSLNNSGEFLTVWWNKDTDIENMLHEPLIQSDKVRTKEIPISSFTSQFFSALYAKDIGKIKQLIRDNPNTAKRLQQELATFGKASGDRAKLYRILARLMEKWIKTISLYHFNPELDRLQEEGRKAFYRLDYLTALEKWQLGLERAQELGNKRYISQFLGNIGLVHNSLGNYQKALEYYQQTLAIHQELGDKRREGMDLTYIGMVHAELGDYLTALDYYQQVLVIHKELGDKRGEGANLTYIGVVYADLGDYSKALDYIKQALAIDKKLGDKHGTGADLTHIGMVYAELGDYLKSLDYLKQALAIHQEVGDKREEAMNLTHIGVGYIELGNYPKALDYLKQALAIHQEVGDKREEEKDSSDIIVHDNLGDVYNKLDNYPKALTDNISPEEEKNLLISWYMIIWTITQKL